MTIEYKDSKRIVALSSDALVAHLKFNDDVTDSAGSNNGTVTGTTTYVTGKIDKGISLNGSSYVTLANESNFDFEHSDPFSMTFWIKMDSGSDGGTYYVNAKQNAGAGQVGLGLLLLSNGELRFGFDTSGGNHRITSSNSVVTVSSGWTHVSITYDGSSNLSGCKIYINGTLDVTGSSSSITSTVLNNVAFVWGASSDGSLDTPATYDDARIYSRELDQNEVKVIYNGGTGTEGNLRPTDVQDNSLLVEKDTARRYWRTPPTSDYTQYGWAVDSTTKIQTLGASASLPSTGTFTWSFWYKPNSISAEHYLFNKLGSQANDYSPRAFLQTTGALKATSTTNNVGYGGNAITSNTMTIGEWNHVIVKQTGSTIYAILNNGTAASASVISGNNSAEDYMLFEAASGTDGAIKNAILYSTALSSSDITSLYNSGVPATSSTAGVTSNILIEHIFDSSVSTTSAANTGSLSGSASVTAGTASVVGTPSTWTRQLPTLPTISDLILHLDANASSTITKDSSNLVATWGDGSSASNDLTASGSARPTWVDDTQTGLPVIRFDGSNNVMTGATSSYSQPNTLFMVCTTPNADSEAMFDGDTSRNLFNRQGTNTYRIYAGAGVTGGTANVAMQVFTVVFNNGSPALNINGSAQSLSGTNIGTSALDDIVLGAFDGGSGKADYDVCEVLFYNKALSTSEISSVESYLNKKWGVY